MTNIKDMSPEEKTQFVSMQTDIQAIKQDLHGMDRKLDKVMVALTGSDVAKDGGLIGRISDLEDEHQKILQELEGLKATGKKTEWYISILWVVAGFVGSIVLQFVINNILKK